MFFGAGLPAAAVLSFVSLGNSGEAKCDVHREGLARGSQRAGRHMRSLIPVPRHLLTPCLGLYHASWLQPKTASNSGVHAVQERQEEASCKPPPTLETRVISLNWLGFFFLFQTAEICAPCTQTQNDVSYHAASPGCSESLYIIPPDSLTLHHHSE